ncbi:MAG: DNA-protecting protein DprA [Dactylosporangium sp.]|nr:DNA-protecting protein DprA [Dactylosporangium sp.]PZN62950.1 MAG: DNA-processing protein DprA [Sphaerobacter thermophilus]
MNTMPQLSPDTQAILLLCGRLGLRGGNAAAPLEVREYNQVARWLHDHGLRPGDLLHGVRERLLHTEADLPFDAGRLRSLLDRGSALALSVERWTSAGIWVLSRGDEDYPERLKRVLGKVAPPLLYGAGDRSLLVTEGLAIVGSRDVDDDGAAFARAVARSCARNGITVISGGARGVDSAALDAALDSGGKAIAVLPGGLRRAISGELRSAIESEQLVIISPYDPDAGFSVGNAMGRNKVIYALSLWAVVVSSAAESGGTWAGAVENLRRWGIPLFVRNEAGVPQGNQQLIARGGSPLTREDIEATNLRERLAAIAPERDAPPPSAGSSASPPGQLSLFGDS